MTTRIAVLDDYIGCAEEFGDWDALGDDVEITFYREAIAPERLVEELAGYDILAITQQRTWLTREVLEEVLALVPDVWLEGEPGFATAGAVREAYVAQLLRRVAASGSWAP